MNFHLVVTQSFGAYQIGDRIEDAAAIEQAQAEHAACVVRVLSDPQPVARVSVAAEPVAPSSAE